MYIELQAYLTIVMKNSNFSGCVFKVRQYIIQMKQVPVRQKKISPSSSEISNIYSFFYVE